MKGLFLIPIVRKYFGSAFNKSFQRNLHNIRIMNEFKHSAILCHKEGDEKFNFSFFLDCPEPKISKQFNMARNVEEPMSNFLFRLKENLLKQTQKKKSKKSKKSKEEDTGSANDSNEVSIIFKNEKNEIIEFDLKDNAKEFLIQTGLKMDIFSVIFHVDINPPIINSAKLPETILAGFMIYPIKLEFEFANKDHSIYSWYVSDANRSNKNINGASWTKKSEGFFHTIENEDIDRFIKERFEFML